MLLTLSLGQIRNLHTSTPEASVLASSCANHHRSAIAAIPDAMTVRVPAAIRLEAAVSSDISLSSDHLVPSRHGTPSGQYFPENPEDCIHGWNRERQKGEQDDRWAS